MSTYKAQSSLQDEGMIAHSMQHLSQQDVRALYAELLNARTLREGCLFQSVIC